jgi:aspartate-semialdehyde dehydrogenase
MKNDPIIAVVGATGLVGAEIVSLIEERHVNCKELRLFASEESMGELYRFREEEIAIEPVRDGSFDGADIVVLATPPDITAQCLEAASDAGAIVIDASGYSRTRGGASLVIPEVNEAPLHEGHKVYANPSATTVLLAPLLRLLHNEGGVRRAVVTTYEGVSGAGRLGLDELWSQGIAIYNQKELAVEAFPQQIAYNCIPQIDVLLEDGWTREEKRIASECRSLLELRDLRISVTAVRVPVFHSLAMQLSVELDRDVDPAKLTEKLEQDPSFEVYPASGDLPTHLMATGTDTLHVGRIRRDDCFDHGLSLWVVGDNVRRAGALNAVRILEELLPPRASQ